MSLIPITGVPSTFYVPGTFGEINFAQGPSTASAGAREILFCMPKSSAGDWTVNQLIQVRSEAEAVDGAGPGSPLHRAIRMFLKANKGAKVYALPYAESSGAGLDSADGYVAISGTATASGLLKVTVCGEEMEIAVNKDDTATALGELVEAQINARTHLPCTANNSAGTVTLTAKIGGKSQGDGTTGVIRFRASAKSGIGITVSTSGAALGLGAGAAGVDGATAEAANLATALATIDNVRKYYVGVSVWDATALTNLVTHVSNKSEPNPGLRSVAVAAFTGALAAGQTLATARNYERLQLVWQPNSEHDCAELVGNVVGVRSKKESVDSAWNFDGHSGADWLIKRAYDAADFPDSNDLNDAITDGLSPVGSRDSGSYLVTSVTTRSKDATGLVDDRRASETHRVSVCDEVLDTHLLRHSNTYVGFKFKDDEVLANGNPNPNQKRMPRVVTPSQYKPFVISILREFEGTGKLQAVDESVEGLQCVKDPNNGGRLEVGYDLNVIDLLHQTTIRISEVSSG